MYFYPAPTGKTAGAGKFVKERGRGGRRRATERRLQCFSEDWKRGGRGKAGESLLVDPCVFPTSRVWNVQARRKCLLYRIRCRSGANHISPDSGCQSA